MILGAVFSKTVCGENTLKPLASAAGDAQSSSVATHRHVCGAACCQLMMKELHAPVSHTHSRQRLNVIPVPACRCGENAAVGDELLLEHMQGQIRQRDRGGVALLCA